MNPCRNPINPYSIPMCKVKFNLGIARDGRFPIDMGNLN
uniref:Sbe1 n=1 Tax=Arundo donax TaxID=35708 RepID=A0A0A9FS26_ARUDO